MDLNHGGLPGQNGPNHQTNAADIARKKVLAIYSAAADKLNGGQTANPALTRQYDNFSTSQSTEQPYYYNPTAYHQNTPYTQNYQADAYYQQQYNDLNNLSTMASGVNQSQIPSYQSNSSQNSSFYQQDPSQTSNYHYNSPYSATSTTNSPQISHYSNSTTNSQYSQNYDINQEDPIDKEIRELEEMTDEEEWRESATTSQPIYTNSSEFSDQATPSALKDTPVNPDVSANWEQYHSAWQEYYQKYYNDYYSKAAQTYLATEKLKNERTASGKQREARRVKHLAPLFIVISVVLVFLFLQYNRLIFAPIMAYIAPDSGNVKTSLEPVDPNLNQPVSPEPRLIIPKLNVDVPVAFGVHFNDIMDAMNYGVAHYAIPGADALPGQIGNFVITGHSAGDVYSNYQYKFIFSGLERLTEGDLIYVNYESVRYTYRMTKSEVVEPSNVGALIYATDKPILTLITCTPLGTSKYRLLVTAEQISPEYQPANPEEQPSEGEIDQNTAEDQGITMPANEPSFFERIWNWLTGK